VFRDRRDGPITGASGRPHRLSLRPQAETGTPGPGPAGRGPGRRGGAGLASGPPELTERGLGLD
jgi:hypothetical protein